MNNIDNTIGLETLEINIGKDNFVPFAYDIGDNEDFTLSKSIRKEFVCPVFSVSQTSFNKKWNDARIILISAVGASGKSWLSKTGLSPGMMKREYSISG